jgi:DNA-binding MarR family transcriptional regulator
MGNKKQTSKLSKRPARSGPPDIRELAQFRYALRKFLRFSESAARECGVTPQQHQLMLGVAGFTGRGCATVSELAEFLQEKNHSVVGLVYRAVQSGLVKRKRDSSDRRVVVVQLTARGERVLTQLSDLHQQEIENIGGVFLTKEKPELRKNFASEVG